MRTPLLQLFACLLFSALAAAQSGSDTRVAPGSSLPGLGGLAFGLNGPGYIEIGGGHSSLSGNYDSWNDFYFRGMVSGGHNIWTGELTRENRFGDSGWVYGLGVNRSFSENWYAQLSASSSIGGFFLPKFRTDVLLNRKLLKRRQLVATVGVGYDKSKLVNSDIRFMAEGTYYFESPFVLQAGLMWTHASPGNILARIQYLALTQGHDKEHYFSIRYEWGYEGYEVIGLPKTSLPTPSVLYDFPERSAAVTWRQWIGPNWGLNVNVEQHQETSYHRWGGTVGVFLDF